MLDIVKLSEELKTKLQQETDILISDRLMTRDVLDARAKELAAKRDEELLRVDQWGAQQKELIAEVFSAMLSELDADRQRNESNLALLRGEAPPPPAGRFPLKPPRHLKAAE